MANIQFQHNDINDLKYYGKSVPGLFLETGTPSKPENRNQGDYFEGDRSH